jgi:hypothetical protein
VTADFRCSFAQQVERSGFLEQLPDLLRYYVAQMRAGSLGVSRIVNHLAMAFAHLCSLMHLPPSAEALLEPLWELVTFVADRAASPAGTVRTRQLEGTVRGLHIAVLDSVSCLGTECVVSQHLRLQLSLFVRADGSIAPDMLPVGRVLSRVCCRLLLRAEQLLDPDLVKKLLEWAADGDTDLSEAVLVGRLLATGLTACQATASAWAADILPPLLQLLGRAGVKPCATLFWTP